MKYYKCTKCDFEFCRAGKVESCPLCNDKYHIDKMTDEQQRLFIDKHMANRKNNI